MSWSERKSEQFKELRIAETRGTLTDKERVMLDELIADLDAEEAKALRFADERLDVQVRAVHVDAPLVLRDQHVLAQRAELAVSGELVAGRSRPSRRRAPRR